MYRASAVPDVFSDEYAESINQKVREILRKNLFLFCNYTPRHEKIFSEKDRFHSSINNLYRLTADSGFVLKCVKKMLCDAQLYHTGRFSDYSDNILRMISNIKTVRTFLVHNIADENGFFDEKVRQDYSIIIGKMEPETEEDYKKLNNDLVNCWVQSLANNITALLNDIKKLSSAAKERLIDEWEKQILLHYVKPYTGLYMGRLAHLYFCKLEADSNYIPTDDIYTQAKNWIKYYFTEQVVHLGKEVEKIQRHIKELEEPDHTIPKEILAKIEIKRLAVLEEEKALLIEKKSALEEAKKYSNLNVEDSFYSFFSNLYEQLRTVLKENPDMSLLPQSILQKHVDTYFGDLGIPSV